MDRLFSHAFEHAAIGIALISVEGNFIQVNPALCELLGYTKKEFSHITVKDITDPQDYEENFGLAQAVLNNKIEKYVQEKRLIHKSGCTVWIQLNVSLVREENGDPMYFVAQLQDITERKKLKEALLATEKNFRLIADNTKDVIGVLDTDFKILYASPSLSAVLGYTEYKGANSLQLFHPDDVATAFHEYEELKKNHSIRRYEFRARHIEGHYIPFETQVTPVINDAGEITQLVFVSRDISEKKQAEKILIESEQLYRSLHESLNYLSKETISLMKKSDLLQMLIQTIGDIFHTQKVGVITVDREGNVKYEQGFTQFPQPKENLYSTEQTLLLDQGYLFARLAHCEQTKTFILVENNKQVYQQRPLIQWLLTISRFSEIIWENLNQIEDILSELKYLIKENQAPAWLLRMLFQVSELERIRLSIDLHDSALQEQIVWFRRLTELLNDRELPVQIKSELERIHDGLDDVIHQIRITCNELRPPFVKQLGIVKALEILFKETHLRSGNYLITFDCRGVFDLLNDDQILGIYRIVQELLANATKHSQATQVNIGLYCDHTQVKLSYQDNGIGIQHHVFYGTSKQIGFYGIRERVRSLEGQVELNDSGDSGLSITILLPLHLEWYEQHRL